MPADRGGGEPRQADVELQLLCQVTPVHQRLAEGKLLVILGRAGFLIEEHLPVDGVGLIAVSSSGVGHGDARRGGEEMRRGA